MSLYSCEYIASLNPLIFEKINGYKDGSFFTPGFITMYMSRETIRRSVVEKLNLGFRLSKVEEKSLNRDSRESEITSIKEEKYHN